MTDKQAAEAGNEEKKSVIAQKEEETLAYWREQHIFEQSIEKNKDNEEFVFFDGPPFATGLPHYGHLLAGTMKDIVPRYQSMKGKKVTRQWGWDCHGLPIENLIEKELGLKTKKDIEEMGVEKFNEAAQDSVLRYEHDWARIVPRTGRWVDMQDKYQTMDTSYTESIWWAFKTLYDKGLIYKGYKSMHLCPRCETTLSNSEVGLGYVDIKDLSVTVKFALKDKPNTYLLAWTTTPWTLPGNAAAAVNPELTYSEVEHEGSIYILAESRIKDVFGEREYTVGTKIPGVDLVGVEYQPVFDYFMNANLPDKGNAWKVYGAEFVTADDGTGIVHIAPAFGEDDFNLAQTHHIPLIHHVKTNGEMVDEVTDFAGRKVKPKDEDGHDHSEMDVEIIKNLAGRGLLFSKEKITHSYPHCWRCDTPLINYATSSWFVKVTDLKEDLVKANKSIKWVPSEVGHKRFAHWLEGARDWAISRTRYWGAPLPVWVCDDCGEVKVIGSISESLALTKRNNEYLVMRHGEADSNVNSYVSSCVENEDHLTEEGRKQAATSAEALKDTGIDLIISSDFARARETAEIVCDTIGFPKNKLIFDKRLWELGARKINKKTWGEYKQFFDTEEKKWLPGEPDMESHEDVRRRVADFLFAMEKEYSGKKILIVSHGDPIATMHSLTRAVTKKGLIKEYQSGQFFHQNAEVRELDFIPYSHNRTYEIDLHRPYIDEVELNCACNGHLSRVPDVFDCWFESGAMPFARHHYPFGNLAEFNPADHTGFPADFIGEGLDQTRGWFYTLLVLSVGLFGEAPYKNVIVNGLVLAEDGKKMSKRLKNYPSSDHILNTYGADALRYYMISSPIVRAEDLNFSEKGVDEVTKKIIMRFDNVVSFYDLYADKDAREYVEKEIGVLDQWMLTRVREVRNEITASLDGYELDRAARPMLDLIDDLSTWYVRRSRDRFKENGEEKQIASAVLRDVIARISVLMAPFMPFLAERSFKTLENEESVHLQNWPQEESYQAQLLTEMKQVRELVSQALELRARANIKVRQPLQSLTIREKTIAENKAYSDLICDEVNVKEVLYSETLTENCELNTELTPELIAEGAARDLVRTIQESRKKNGLMPGELIVVTVPTGSKGKDILDVHSDAVKQQCSIKEIKTAEYGGDGLFGEVVIEKVS